MARIIAHAGEMYSTVRRMRRLSAEYRRLAREVAASPSTAMPSSVHATAKGELRQAVVALQGIAEELQKDSLILEIRGDWAVRADRDIPFRRTIHWLEVSGQALDLAIAEAELRITRPGYVSGQRWIVRSSDVRGGHWRRTSYSQWRHWRVRGGVAWTPSKTLIHGMERWERGLKWGGPALTVGLTAATETLEVWDYSHLTRQEKITRVAVNTAVASVGAIAGGALLGTVCSPLAATGVGAAATAGCVVVGASAGAAAATWGQDKFF